LTPRSVAAKRLSFDPLLMGFYAWLLTVGVPSFSGDAPIGSRLLSLAALAVLATGWSLGARYPVISDWLATFGYLSLCLVGWMSLGHARLTANMAELRTFLGAVAWGLFGVAWVRSRYEIVCVEALGGDDAPRAAGRSASGGRGMIHVGVSLALAMAVFARLGILDGSGRGVFCTALALAWALWLLATSGVAAERLERRSVAIGLRLVTEPSIVLAILLTGAAVVGGAIFKP
jgi:hypothetical protein